MLGNQIVFSLRGSVFKSPLCSVNFTSEKDPPIRLGYYNAQSEVPHFPTNNYTYGLQFYVLTVLRFIILFRPVKQLTALRIRS